MSPNGLFTPESLKTKVWTKVQTKVCVFAEYFIHLTRFILVSHCNYGSALNSYTQHASRLSSSPARATSPYTCSWVICRQAYIWFQCVVNSFHPSSRKLIEKCWVNQMSIKQLPCSSPRVLCSSFYFVVLFFSFSGPNNILQEPTVICPKFHMCNIGSDQTKKSESLDGVKGHKTPDAHEDQNTLLESAKLILCLTICRTWTWYHSQLHTAG